MKKSRFTSLLLALSLAVGLFSPLPVLAKDTPPAPEPVSSITEGEGNAESRLLSELSVAATAAILVDADARPGTASYVLYGQDAHEKRYPASVTKVMTALLVVEAIDRGELSRDQIITVGPEVNREVGEGSSTQYIGQGEQLRLEDLLYCALTASANEACNVLAQAVSGSVSSFVELMNRRARELGMEGTHFSNTHGYHNENHYTTAYDISLMCREAMKHELFRTVVSTKSHTVPATNYSPARELYDTNALISDDQIEGYRYAYATGIKTGTTPEAGYCLASSASKDGRSLIAVVLGCEREPGTTGSQGLTHFKESQRLLEWGFGNTGEATVLDSDGFYYEMPVTLSSQAEHVGVRPSGSVTAILPKDLDPALFRKEARFFELSLEAPVEKGQVLGEITVSNGGVVYGKLDLVAANGVESSGLLYQVGRLETFFAQGWVKITLLVILIPVAVFILLVLYFRIRWRIARKRRRRISSSSARRGTANSGARRRR